MEEGFTRLDALNHIGNIVFSVDLDNEPANYVGYTAPVHFPRIWNASWFEWVQYNGSIAQPMARNAGEALGVGAKLNLTDAKKPLYSSSVDLKELFAMEQQPWLEHRRRMQRDFTAWFRRSGPTTYCRRSIKISPRKERVYTRRFARDAICRR